MHTHTDRQSIYIYIHTHTETRTRSRLEGWSKMISLEAVCTAERHYIS